MLTCQLGLAVYHLDSSLMAGGGAGTAAVAFFFIDFYNFTDHFNNLL
jgi:hypothetical protein